MKNISKYLLKILTNSFIVSMVSLVIAGLSPQDSVFRYVFGSIGFYGGLITIYIFLIAVVLFFVARFFEKR